MEFGKAKNRDRAIHVKSIIIWAKEAGIFLFNYKKKALIKLNYLKMILH
jgi:hypothetical protein